MLLSMQCTCVPLTMSIIQQVCIYNLWQTISIIQPVCIYSLWQTMSIIRPVCTYNVWQKVKGKTIPVQAYYRPWGFQELEAPRFLDIKVIRLSALCTGCLYPQGNIPDTHFYHRLSRPHSRSAAGRIMAMKNSSDTIRNRTRNLPACSAKPQPTVLLCDRK